MTNDQGQMTAGNSSFIVHQSPEVIPLPAAATALALGQLDKSFEMDLAIAAGHDLVILHGRDRQLSFSHENDNPQSEIRNPKLERRSFPFEIRSLALGDFVWDEQHQTDIALLADDGAVHLLSNPHPFPRVKIGSARLRPVRATVLVARPSLMNGRMRESGPTTVRASVPGRPLLARTPIRANPSNPCTPCSALTIG